MSAEEKRRFSRIAIEGEVAINLGGERWNSRLIDLSLKGALVQLPDGWSGRVGDRCALEINIGGGVTIFMDTITAHVGSHHIGFRCHQIDLDSISHLKRLVELNLGDESALERELGELAAPH